jgi:hypothetical protein
MRYVILLLLLSQFTFAQNVKYDKELAGAISCINQNCAPTQLLNAFKKLEQLSIENPKDWLAPYYAGMVKIKLSLLNSEDADNLADQALDWVTKAKSIQLNDEVLCLECMAYSAKMSIHPTRRWLLYEGKIKEPLAAAKKINPNNPRIYILEANIAFHIPALFGGGCKQAMPIALKAAHLLAAQGTRPGNLPNWGAQKNQEVLAGCKYE